MKVIDVDNMSAPERCINFTGGRSIRPILGSEGVGFGVHKTIIPKGGPYHWHYPFHLEACYCIQGEGELTDLKTGYIYVIVPGVLYLLDEHDSHTFEAIEDTILISVFNPPVMGDEHHDSNGHYPKSDYVKMLSEKIVTAVNSCDNDYDAKYLIEQILINKNHV